MAVFAVTVGVFALNARNDFIRLDDIDYIAQNGNIKDGLTLSSAKWAFGAVGYSSNWHPFTWISHAADVTAAKVMGIDYAEEANPLGYWARMDSPFAKFVHAENVVLHALCAVLLLWVILLLMRGDAIPSNDDFALASFLSLLWALHPLRVEVVAWAAERKELLSVLFMLLTMGLYLSGRFAFAIVAYALALLAKPVAVGIPVVLLAIDVCRGKVDLKRLIPYCGLAAATCVLTLRAQENALQMGRDLSVGTRALCALEAPVIYLWQTICPIGLSVDYALPSMSSVPVAVLGALLVASMLCVCILWFRRRNAWTNLGMLAIAWCYVGLVPMLGIVKVGNQPHSDRYTYWVSCGMAAVAAMAVSMLSEKRRIIFLNQNVRYSCLVVLVVLSSATIARSLVWKDNLTLFRDAVAKSHNEEKAQILAEELSRIGLLTEARHVLSETIDAKGSADAYGEFALFLSIHGSSAEADLFARKALEKDGENPYALGAMGMMAKSRGDTATAVAYLEKATARFPSYQLTSALEYCRKALSRKVVCE